MLFLVDTNGVPSVGVVHPPEPGAAGGRHDAADRLADGAGGRRDRRRHASNVSANAADNDAVAGVQFKLDGADLGAEDASAPYSVSLGHDDCAPTGRTR